VFVFGCFPVIGMHQLNLLTNVVVIKNGHLQEIEKYFPPLKVTLNLIKDGNDIYYDATFGGEVFLIRISRGCYGNCSYCAIKKAIGRHISKSISTIIDEVELAIKGNYSYIRLIADDGGGYGIDIGTNIVCLLEKISMFHQIKGIELEINPKWIIKYKIDFVRYMNEHPNLYFKMSIPIQSFSNDVLRNMNRSTNMQKFDMLLKKIKSYGKHIFLTTHIIVGYPTESKDDLDLTICSLVSHKFDQINLFPFTLHPHSKIAKIFKSMPQNVQDRADYAISKLCSNGYDIWEASKSASNNWQHVILRRST
jgi:tRNA A37 methylthiotransferase MiaB